MTLLVLRWLLAALMTSAGVMHFVAPKGFARIVPKVLPQPMLIVYVSGVFEIAGGVGLVVPVRIIQQIAGYGLVALFIAVFPANLNMAVNKLPLGRKVLPDWALWARLPVQLVLIAWAWVLARAV